jgi:outer membrane protein
MAGLCLVLLTTFAPALAQDAAGSDAAATQKIGVFDIDKLLADSSEGALIQARLDRLSMEKRQIVEDKQRELQAKVSELEAGQASLAEDRKRQLSLEVQRLRNDLESVQKTAQQEFQLEYQEAQLEWNRKVRAAALRYGEDNGYSLILPVEVVFYYSKAIDVTEDLARMIDEQADAGQAASGS